MTLPPRFAQVWRHLLPLVMILAGAMLLCWPTYWNGFPLVYSDTGAYLATAFEGKLPMARPTGYGLLIRYLSLGGHLRLVLLAQGLLVAGLAWRAFRVALPQVDLRVAFPLVFGASIGLTGLAWYASQLMPDIFTGLVVLAFYLMLYDEAARWWGRMGYGFLAYWFCFAHYSHTALLLGLAAAGGAMWGMQALRRRGRPFAIGRLGLAAVPAFVALFSYAYVNNSHGLGWRFTRSSHVFTMARLCETGLLRDYLHETCAEAHWALCPYADSLPATAADFIWRDDSPFKKTGYWEGSKPGYDSLLADFFGRGKYLRRYASEAVQAGTLQMFELSVGEGVTPYNESSSPYKFFERRMPEKLPAYRAAKQFERLFDFEVEKMILYVAGLGSLLALVVILAMRGGRLRVETLALAWLCLVSYGMNAFITGAFANVYARLQARISWLILLGLGIVLLDLAGFLRKKA